MTIAMVPEALRIIDEKRREVGASGAGETQAAAGFLNALLLVAEMAAHHLEAAHDYAMDCGDRYAMDCGDRWLSGQVAWRLTLIELCLRKARAV